MTIPNPNALETITQKVIAIDPGGTSGICIFRPQTMIVDTVEKYQIQSFELTKAHTLWQLLIDERPDVVVVERFSASRIDVWGLYTVTLVGGVLALCQSLGVQRFIHLPSFKEPWMRQADAELITERTANGQRTFSKFGKPIKRGFSDHEQDSRAHFYCWKHRSKNGTFDYQEKERMQAFSGQPLDI